MKTILQHSKNGFKYELETISDDINVEEAADCGFPSFVANLISITDKRYTIGSVRFSQFPGCNAIIVTSELYINPQYRGKGYSGIFQDIRELMAKKLGASRMLATIDMNNVKQVASCLSHRWKIIDTFKNKNTGNLVATIQKELY